MLGSGQTRRRAVVRRLGEGAMDRLTHGRNVPIAVVDKLRDRVAQESQTRGS
jgi:hypothetical protein